MNLNLSSQIVLNTIPEQFYRPRTAVERSEITRAEKMPTELFTSVDEGAAHIADAIEKTIRLKADKGQNCILGLGTGISLTPIYDELVRRHHECGLSFRNVIVFNAYEYYPLTPDAAHSSITQLRERLLSRVNINPNNVFTPDGTIAQDKVQAYCRQYEQRIKGMGGIDIMLLGIGRLGNIATNEPGSALSSTSRIILLDHTSREEMTMSFGSETPVPPCSITMGIQTIMQARKIFLTAWGESKADIICRAIEDR